MQKQNEQLKSAMDDISIIRHTLEKSKFNMGKMASLFLWYGGVMLFACIAKQICSFFLIKAEAYDALGVLNYLSYLVLAVLFVFFVRMRKNIKKCNSIYTLQLFDIWGAVLFFVPLSRILLTVMLVCLRQTLFVNGVSMMLHGFSLIIEYSAVGFGVLITGFIINKKSLKIFGVILILIYYAVFCFGVQEMFNESIASLFGVIAQRKAVMYMINLIVYIVLGVYFKLQNGGEKNGAE